MADPRPPPLRDPAGVLQEGSGAEDDWDEVSSHHSGASSAQDHREDAAAAPMAARQRENPFARRRAEEAAGAVPDQAGGWGVDPFAEHRHDARADAARVDALVPREYEPYALDADDPMPWGTGDEYALEDDSFCAMCEITGEDENGKRILAQLRRLVTETAGKSPKVLCRDMQRVYERFVRPNMESEEKRKPWTRRSIYSHVYGHARTDYVDAVLSVRRLETVVERLSGLLFERSTDGTGNLRANAKLLGPFRAYSSDLEKARTRQHAAYHEASKNSRDAVVRATATGKRLRTTAALADEDAVLANKSRDVRRRFARPRR